MGGERGESHVRGVVTGDREGRAGGTVGVAWWWESGAAWRFAGSDWWLVNYSFINHCVQAACQEGAL